MRDFEASVQKIVDRRVKVELEKALESIEKGNGRVRAPRAAKAEAAPVEKAKAKRKGPPSKARQLQGQYMAAVRSLSAKNKAAVSKLRIEKGMVAAVAEAKRLNA